MKTQETINENGLVEIWVVASKDLEGKTDISKIIGISYENPPKNSKWGESVFFKKEKDAEAFLRSINEDLRKYFGVFSAWMKIK